MFGIGTDASGGPLGNARADTPAQRPDGEGSECWFFVAHRAADSFRQLRSHLFIRVVVDAVAQSDYKDFQVWVGEEP